MTRGTVTVTSHEQGKGKGYRFTLTFSKLPGQSYGPYEFPDAVIEVWVAGNLDRLAARDLVLSSVDGSKSGTSTASLD